MGHLCRFEWTVSCLESRERVHSKPASTRCYTALVTCVGRSLLHLSPSPPPPPHPCCLSVSTFPVVVWDMASGCLGCQLLPAHTVTSSPATSAPHANATAGHYWAFVLSRLPVPAEAFHVVWTIWIGKLIVMVGEGIASSQQKNEPQLFIKIYLKSGLFSAFLPHKNMIQGYIKLKNCGKKLWFNFFACISEFVAIRIKILQKLSPAPMA